MPTPMPTNFMDEMGMPARDSHSGFGQRASDNPMAFFSFSPAVASRRGRSISAATSLSPVITPARAVSRAFEVSRSPMVWAAACLEFLS